MLTLHRALRASFVVDNTVALRTCPECEAEASTRVPACIRCGYRFELQRFCIPMLPWHFVLQLGRTITGSGVLLALLAGFALL
ncbi:MAG: hypothetical protein ACYTG7_26030, partial [Planctomycetota bacterium]